MIKKGFKENCCGDCTVWVGVDARHILRLMAPNTRQSSATKQNESWLVGYFKQILEAFGFTYSTALGKAGVELSLMSQANTIDVVLAEDSESMVFGTAVIVQDRHIGNCVMLTAVVGECLSPKTCFLDEACVALAIPTVLLKSICKCLLDWPLSKSALADLEEQAKRSRAWCPRVLVEHARPELLTAYKLKISKNKHDGSSKANESNSSSHAMTQSPQKATSFSTPTNHSQSSSRGKKRQLSSGSEVEVSKISPRAFGKM
ncbi:hypothetical protein FIBSPDRAFT_884907 [Athelia psychrophila]|uniref:XPG-I domain-containing protein n=1 Tax=Athelia psychrophila TaxID=1759441 RepID=A0A166SIP3_9AGAM|nr:hypothetical protein FIBSPDRAFT_884907 [Fibularhizoctonia sp. CBS 109695]